MLKNIILYIKKDFKNIIFYEPNYIFTKITKIFFTKISYSFNKCLNKIKKYLINVYKNKIY